MKTLKFSGHSTNIFGEYNQTNEYVKNYINLKPVKCLLSNKEGKMYVIGQYSKSGNSRWDIGVAPFEEGTNIPSWTIRVSLNAYSAILEIDVPEDTTLTWVDKRKHHLKTRKEI